MREYELTYLISDNVPESDLNKVTGKVGGYITNCDGKILHEEIWGRRKLAYPIQKQDFATYVTINFSLMPDRAIEFEKNIFLTGKIIRHLMIVKGFSKEGITLTKEDIAEIEEIEVAAGGEKSFEAIVGETEESRDLMAKRETAKESKPEEEETEAIVEKAPKEIKKDKPAKKDLEKAPKEKKTENEADRLSMLDKELDDILGDDI